MRAALLVSLIPLAALLSACASRSAAPVMSTQGSTVVQTARVTDVRDVTVRGGQPSGLGAFAGAVLGGVAGSRIGSGYGSTAASIGGALAGSMAGQHAEQAAKSRSTMALTVQFENGETRTYHVEPDARFRIGDTVRVTTSGGVTRITH